MTFEITLSRPITAELWNSVGADKSDGAKLLQSLFDAGKEKAYEAEKGKLENEQGKIFRKTNGKVFELFKGENTTKVFIKFQVKLGTITWYVMGPKDETYQSFRDELYHSAGIGHMSKVENHCQAYWRGTNSFHLKKMHTDEDEDNYNHNHYRVENDMDINPDHVFKHLTGMVEAQREMGLVDENGNSEKFVTMGDVAEISHKFNVHWAKVNHVGDAKAIRIGNEIVHLPQRSISILSEYKESRASKLTEEDIKEWQANRHREEPCREMTITKDMTIAKKREVAAKGSRGIGSELAETRQLDWSTRLVNNTVVVKDDKLPEKPKTTSNLNPNQTS